MRSIRSAGIGLVASCALAVTACADLPALGECGNGIVERELGEGCDEPDGPACSGCLLTCVDRDAAGACPGAQCCAADERCGIDRLCRRPSGTFASPARLVPFASSQHTIADVDGDGVGDVMGVTREQATFLFGDTSGELTRTDTAPIPPLSRAEGQVSFFEIDYFDRVVPAAAFATERGFALAVAVDGEIVSPALPELDFEDPDEPSAVPDRGLAAAPSALFGIADVITIAEENLADSSGENRVVVRVYRGREQAAGFGDPTPCDATFRPDVPAAAILRVGGAIEYAAVAISQIRPGALPTDPVIPSAALCLYPSPPQDTGERVVQISAEAVIAAVRIAELDGDACPEVVFEEVLPLQLGMRWVRYADFNGAGCTPDPLPVEIVEGHLLGVGDLNGDGIDEVLIDLANGDGEVYTIAGPPLPQPVLLPDALHEAIVADVNRDGRLDIVAVSDPLPDLTVILNTPYGFAPRTVASVGALHDLVTADFDGDTFPDIAAIEVSGDGEELKERVVVGFGGPFGPQELAGIGRMVGIRSLAAFVDVQPGDPFADLMMIQVSRELDEVAVFAGAGTRALTSQIDLSGAPETGGDDGASFGRTMIGGSVLAPEGDGTDFCMISLQGDPNMAGTIPFAFCVGGRGTTIGFDFLDDAMGFDGEGGATGKVSDWVDAEDVFPIFAVASIGQLPGGEPRPFLVAIRRDVHKAPVDLVVMAPPADSTSVPRLPDPLNPVGPSYLVQDVIPLAVPEDTEHAAAIVIVNLRAVELDSDPDTELVVSVVDIIGDANPDVDPMYEPTFASRLVRIDLAFAGGTVTATAAPMLDPQYGPCDDIGLVELGQVVPDGHGTPSPEGRELVVQCDGNLLAQYRTEDGIAGPFSVGTSGLLGSIAVGDVTGDRIDDIVVVAGDNRDAVAAVLIQCPMNDRIACSPAFAVE